MKNVHLFSKHRVGGLCTQSVMFCNLSCVFCVIQWNTYGYSLFDFICITCIEDSDDFIPLIILILNVATLVCSWKPDPRAKIHVKS